MKNHQKCRALISTQITSPCLIGITDSNNVISQKAILAITPYYRQQGNEKP